jgi:hypothetical protein
VKLTRFRKPKASCFLSSVEYSSPQIQAILQRHRKYIGRGDQGRRKRRKEDGK